MTERPPQKKGSFRQRQIVIEDRTGDSVSEIDKIRTVNTYKICFLAAQYFMIALPVRRIPAQDPVAAELSEIARS